MMMNNKKSRYSITLVLVLCILTIFNGCKPTQKAADIKSDVKNVKVYEVKAMPLATSVEYPGNLNPVEEINIMPSSSGKVQTLNVSVGQQVKQGDTLFTLDTRDAQAQYSQSQASLQGANASYYKTSDSGLAESILNAKAEVDKAQVSYDDAKRQYDQNEKNPASSQSIAQAENDLKQAQTSYDKAKDDYDKKLLLYQAGVISKSELDGYQTSLDNAKLSLNKANDNVKILKDKQASDYKVNLDNATINLNKAKEAYAILKAKSGPQSVEAAKAQVEQAEASVKSALVQLENGKIVSPITGTVSICNIDVGEMASPSATAITVINTSALKVEVSVSDKMIDKISKGKTLPVKIDAMGDKTYEGMIDSISPSADASSHTYTVKVKVDNQDNSIKSGMFARVKFPTEQKDNVMAVPNQAIKMESNVQYIYKVVEGAVKKEAIETGLTNETYTEIKDNLKQGDLIITEGQTFLNNGEKVNVVKEEKTQ